MKTNEETNIIDEEKIIGLNLNIDELNKILSALGNLPYIQVFQLINKIQMQVGNQIEAASQLHGGNGQQK